MSKPSYIYKTLNRAVGKALHQYDMISDKDRILVGLSGGKDSLTLLSILKERQPRIPIKYELFAVCIDPGFEGGFSEALANYCDGNGFKLIVEYTDYGILAHKLDKPGKPLFFVLKVTQETAF